jgi:transcriptional regulator with XRE-family HTH domain
VTEPREQDGAREGAVSMPSEQDDSPTAVRMLVGSQLRRLREEQSLTRAQAGYKIRASESKLSRMELGRVGFKLRDVEDLLRLYGVIGTPESEELLALVQRANEPGWWESYHDVTPHWFARYLGLEATATLIRSYEAQFVPGLLQTEDYARAVVRLGHGSASADEVERRVGLRLRRQQAVLHRPDPPTLWAVIDEAALRRPVGGPKVMRDQIEALAELVTKGPHVRLQVIPLDAGGHAAAGGSFTILRFGRQRPHLKDLVYLEQLTGALYLERREDVEVYFDVVNRLYVEAAPPAQTVRILHRIVHDYSQPSGDR